MVHEIALRFETSLLAGGVPEVGPRRKNSAPHAAQEARAAVTRLLHLTLTLQKVPRTAWPGAIICIVTLAGRGTVIRKAESTRTATARARLYQDVALVLCIAPAKAAANSES